jgi:hypothetical protein
MGRKDQVTTFDYIVKFAILLGFALSAILVFSFVYLKRGGRPRHRWLAVSIWSMYVGGFTAVLRQIEHHIGVHFADVWALIAIFGALKSAGIPGSCCFERDMGKRSTPCHDGMSWMAVTW